MTSSGEDGTRNRAEVEPKRQLSEEELPKRACSGAEKDEGVLSTREDEGETDDSREGVESGAASTASAATLTRARNESKFMAQSKQRQVF